MYAVRPTCKRAHHLCRAGPFHAHAQSLTPKQPQERTLRLHALHKRPLALSLWSRVAIVRHVNRTLSVHGQRRIKQVLHAPLHSIWVLRVGANDGVDALELAAPSADLHASSGPCLVGACTSCGWSRGPLHISRFLVHVAAVQWLCVNHLW